MKKLILILIFLISLKLIADTVPPYVDPLYPEAGATGIPVDTDVTFHIYDTVDGVDINSVTVNINGIVYTSASSSFFYSGTPFDYIITVNPPANFQFEDQIFIQVNAQDLESPPNVMPTYEYNFETIEDFQPPYVGGLDPEANAVNVPQDTDIEFIVYDSGIGVNLSSIVVEIQGVTYTHNSGSFTYNGNANAYQIIIDVPVNFAMAEVVDVVIDASDLNGITMATFEYSFQIIEDVQPPFTGEWDPQPDETDVPIDSNVSFNIYDNIEGVDINSVVVEVQGLQYTYLNTSFTFQTIPNGYSVIIDLANDFDYGENVNVQIDAADLSQPANVMTPYQYSFQCEYDILAPYIGEYDPPPGQQNVPIDTNVNFHVYDDDLGVDISSLNVNVDGVEYSVASGNLSYTGTPADYWISINPTENFDFAQFVTVEIDVADLSVPANQLSGFTYSFQCVIDEEAPYITDLDPQAYSVDNPVNTNISFHIRDDGFGVDINSVSVLVQNIEYSLGLGNLFYSGDVNDYQIIVDPPQNFNSVDTVYVSIDASDMAVPANTMETFSYYFECELLDEETPYITDLDPQAYSVDNPVNTNISFHIRDDGFGVDINSVSVLVQNIEYSLGLGNLFYSGDVNDYQIIVDPPQNFNSADTVYVSIDASDMAVPANTMGTFSYSFECELLDEIPPFILQEFPADEAVGVPVTTPISCYILDSGNQVDSTSITMQINDEEIIDFELEPISIPGSSGFILSYQSSQPFNNNETVTWEISAADLAVVPNILTGAVFSFVCAENQPPTIELPDSLVCDEDDMIERDFSFYITDPENVEPILEAASSNNLEITISEYIVTIVPETNWFGTENISFIIKDEMGEPITSDSTNIVVRSINDAPSFDMNLFPEEVSFVENEQEIIDFVDMIIDPEQQLEELTLTVTGNSDIIIDVSEFVVTFSAPENWSGSEMVSVTIDDNINRAICTEELLVKVTPEIPTINLPDSLVCDEDDMIERDFSFYITDPENYEPILEAALSNNLEITISEYMVTIVPAANWFGTENISFIIKDEMGEPIASDSTNIVVRSINDAPSFDMSLFPEEVSFVENEQEIIDFSDMIIDPEQQSEELTLTITGNSDIILDVSEFVVTFSAPENWSGSETVSVTIDDNINRAICTEELLVKVTREIPDERVAIDPHTVTWNDASCKITIYSQVDKEKISGRIFNRSGKLIKNLEIQQYGENKLTSWDKSDTDQNPVSGGFYIYQIKIKERIYQGSIIIAR